MGMYNEIGHINYLKIEAAPPVLGIFSDGFETGNTSAWSSTRP